MNQQQLRDRTKLFAKRLVGLCHSLPREWDVREIGEAAAAIEVLGGRELPRLRAGAKRQGVLLQTRRRRGGGGRIAALARAPARSASRRRQQDTQGAVSGGGRVDRHLYCIASLTARTNLQKKNADKKSADRCRAPLNLEENPGLRFPNLQIPRFPNALAHNLRDGLAIDVDLHLAAAPWSCRRRRTCCFRSLRISFRERVLLLGELVGDDVLALDAPSRSRRRCR